MSNHNFIIRTNKTSPCPHAKKLHAFGSWARVRWDAEPGTPYDGLWNQTNLQGLVRASRNGLLLKSTHPLGTAENRDRWGDTEAFSLANATEFVTKFSIALRLCPSNFLAGCEDIVFLPKKTVAWEGGHLFGQTQHTNVTGLDPWTKVAFSQVSTEPGFVKISHVGEDSSPTELRLEPSKTFVEIWENGKDWRQTIALLPKGTVLYTAYDEHNNRIGNLTQTSESWVASEVGDTRVTFHHHIKEDASIDLQPTQAPPSIPIEWFWVPSIITIINRMIYRAFPQVDPFFGISKADIAKHLTRNPVLQSVASALFDEVVTFTPSTGALTNYFIPNTAETIRFAERNQATANILQSIDATMVATQLGAFGRTSGQWETKPTFTTSPRYNQRTQAMIQSIQTNLIANTNTNSGTGNDLDEIQAVHQVTEVLRRHKTWFANAFQREHAFWRRMGRESLASNVHYAAQNDPRRFRFALDIENDAWVDIHGGNRSCPKS